jgi:hypothetical protein
LFVIIFLSVFSCQIDSTDFESEIREIYKLSEKYGFEVEKIDNSIPSEKKIVFENLEEYEKFLNYLRTSYDFNDDIDYVEIKRILSKNGLDIDNLLMQNDSQSNTYFENDLKSGRIQCVPNAMLVYARVRNMPLPGFQDGLNGVQIGMEFENGNLKPEKTTWGMYGFYPFLGVKNGQIIQLQPPSFANNYTTTLTAHYTVVWYSMVGDISIANFATMKVDIKVNACSGETVVLWTEI